MHNIINNLYVGDDSDYERVKDDPKFKTLRCCKEGSGGHRETLDYHTRAAPDGPNYLAVIRPNRMALNFIDPLDPNFIKVAMIKEGLTYIQEQLAAGYKVLVACNAGHSRGPTTAMLYLRSIGELPSNFIHSERIFRTLYPDYDPNIGVRTFARNHWQEFDDLLKDKNKNGEGN